MSPTLYGIDQKLKRAVAHINNLDHQIAAFRDLKPYSVRVQEDTHQGHPVGRLVAVKNPGVGEPDVALVLLAGEALYQLRSALDHLVHQLVILNGNATKLTSSRRHQFPIFEAAQGYSTRAAGMIDGVSQAVADAIEREQPYARSPTAATDDPLWVLQDLNNTDKHRLVPISVLGIGEIRGRDNRGDLFTLSSPDIVLEDNKVLWSFTTPEQRYDDIRSEISCAIAFQQAMHIHGATASLDDMLWYITSRVHQVVSVFRPLFPV